MSPLVFIIKLSEPGLANLRLTAFAHGLRGFARCFWNLLQLLLQCRRHQQLHRSLPTVAQALGGLSNFLSAASFTLASSYCWFISISGWLSAPMLAVWIQRSHRTLLRHPFREVRQKTRQRGNKLWFITTLLKDTKGSTNNNLC